VIYQGAKARLDSRTLYYTDLFSVMIFTDVLILILSLLVSDRYERRFPQRRFRDLDHSDPFLTLPSRDLTAPPLALLGMCFGILTILVYNYNTRIHGGRPAR